ncbi:MAG: hypothetical protein Q9175_006473, partial [Cornicularia normoerica]
MIESETCGWVTRSWRNRVAELGLPCDESTSSTGQKVYDCVAQEDATDRDTLGGHKGDYAKGEHGIEGDGGARIDEGHGDGEEAGHEDGVA